MTSTYHVLLTFSPSEEKVLHTIADYDREPDLASWVMSCIVRHVLAFIEIGDCSDREGFEQYVKRFSIPVSYDEVLDFLRLHREHEPDWIAVHDPEELAPKGERLGTSAEEVGQ